MAKKNRKATWLIELESKFYKSYDDHDIIGVEPFRRLSKRYKIDLQSIIEYGIITTENLFGYYHEPAHLTRYNEETGSNSDDIQKIKIPKKYYRLPARFYYSSGMLHQTAWKALCFKKAPSDIHEKRPCYQLLNHEHEGFAIDPNSELELEIAIGRELFKYNMRHIVSEFTVKKINFGAGNENIIRSGIRRNEIEYYGFYILDKRKLKFTHTCIVCNNKHRHYCQIKKGWTLPKRCSCGGYDDHYCTIQNRWITLCMRCDTDDRMCFCC